MKLTRIVPVAAMALAMASCQTPAGKQLSEIDNATPGDSMIYYFGQVRGAEYLRMAESDTTFASPEARKAYLEGVEAGLKAAKDKENAYTQGLFLGVQMAMNIKEFSNDYQIVLSPRIFLDALAATVNADSTVNSQDCQREFYRLMNQFNEEKERNDKEAASIALKDEALKQGLPELAPDLYGKVEATDAPKIKIGDVVKLSVVLDRPDGEPIPAPLPNKLTVGQRLKDSPVTAALLNLSSGQTGTFLTTAHALFGQRSQQMKLKPTDVIKMRVTGTIDDEKE